MGLCLIIVYYIWIYISLYGTFTNTMPATITKKRKPAKSMEKTKKSDYQKYIVEPSRRLANLLDRLDKKATRRVKSG